MNAFFQKAFDNINFLIEHPLESLIVFVVSIIISTILINFLYSERIATLEERVKLSNDLVDFYKNVNSELEKKTSTSQSHENNESSIQPGNTPKNVREGIIAAIILLESKTGRALSIEIFDVLKHDFDFGVILAELLRMQKDGIINWKNSPNPPDAHTVITSVIRHGSS